MTDLIGQTIGNYQIEALLGKGGMGQVFRARHLRLSRQAAIKVIHAPLSSESAFRARFAQEARTAASLTHPHIVTVYDYGEQDGQAYLAMELVLGGSLRDRLRQQAALGQGWPLAIGLELIRQAADALDYAHAQGMVHRDIKPDNLLLDDDPALPDAAPILKVGDFGLARLIASSHLTATGTAMGTPAYMSPEQCQGGELDGRSDLYALGVVLYELACGRVPFIVKTPYDAVYQHLNVAPPPPRQLRPDLPEALEAIILRCLAKAPGDRFATGAALAAALAQVGHGGQAGLGTMVVPIPEAALFDDLAATVRQDALPLGATPPDVATLLGGARPLIRVLDGQGTTVQVLELRGARLTVGRAPDNDLHLEGAGVSRHHLTVTWDGAQVEVTDLGAANGTLLAGQALAPSTPQAWPWRAVVQLGPYWLRLEPPLATATPALGRTPALGNPPALGNTPAPGSTPALGNATASLSRSFQLTERLELRLESTVSTFVPGQPTPVHLTLLNRGRTTDQVSLTVRGVPEGWVSGGAATVLRPGEQTTVLLTVLVPIDAEVAAGERLVTVRARSKERPAEGAQAAGRWTVLPFQALQLELTPARVVGRRQARYQIQVTNAGNALSRYRLAVEDESGALQATLEPEEVELAAGERAQVRLVVEQAGRLSGATVARRFTVQASAGEAEAASASAVGQMVQPALLPTWGVPALLGLLGLLVLCAFGALPAALAGWAPGYGVLSVPRDTAPATDAVVAALPTATPLPTLTAVPTPANAGIATVIVIVTPLATTTSEPTATPGTTETALELATVNTSAATALAEANATSAAGQTTAAQPATAAAEQIETTALPTATPIEVPTDTSTETPTEVPPTDTPTEAPPTETPMPPTSTPVPPSATPEPPTATPTLPPLSTLISYWNWNQDQGSATVMIPVSEGICVLQKVSGGFKGGGEYVQIRNNGSYWELAGSSLQLGVSANAMCISTIAIRSSVNYTTNPVTINTQTSPGILAKKSQNLVGSFCYLTAMSGVFNGGGEQIQISPTDSNHSTWILQLQTQAGYISADAGCISLVNSRSSRITGSFSWAQGQPPVELANVDQAFCALTMVQGSFVGGGELVEITDSNGRYVLGGASQQVGVAARAQCFYYDQAQS